MLYLVGRMKWALPACTACSMSSQAGVLIVAAGMKGPLSSVVGGLIRSIITVPTSARYGARFGRPAARLTMLNSCAG